MIYFLYKLIFVMIICFDLMVLWHLRKAIVMFYEEYKELLRSKTANKYLFSLHKHLFINVKKKIPKGYWPFLYFSNFVHNVNLIIPYFIFCFIAAYVSFVLTPVSHYIPFFLWPLAGLFLFVTGAIIYLNKIASKRTYSFQQDFPEIIHIITNAMRGGSDLFEAIVIAVKKTTGPVHEVFESILYQVRLGGDIEQILDYEKENIKDIDFIILASAISINIKAGGRLLPILTRYQEIMQNRKKLLNKIRLAIAVAKANARTLQFIMLGLSVGMASTQESTYTYFTQTEQGNELVQWIVIAILVHFALVEALAWWAGHK